VLLLADGCIAESLGVGSLLLLEGQWGAVAFKVGLLLVHLMLVWFCLLEVILVLIFCCLASSAPLPSSECDIAAVCFSVTGAAVGQALLPVCWACVACMLTRCNIKVVETVLKWRVGARGSFARGFP
jgi:hypothetical protein